MAQLEVNQSIPVPVGIYLVFEISRYTCVRLSCGEDGASLVVWLKIIRFHPFSRVKRESVSAVQVGFRGAGNITQFLNPQFPTFIHIKHFNFWRQEVNLSSDAREDFLSVTCFSFETPRERKQTNSKCAKLGAKHKTHLLSPNILCRWGKKWQPTPVSLPRKSHCQRSLVSYTLWGHKSPDRTEQLNNNPLQ